MALPCLWCKAVQSFRKAGYKSSIPASSTPLWSLLSTFFVLHHLIRRSQGYAHYFRGPHSAMLVCPTWMELLWWRDRHPAPGTLPVACNRSATEWPLIFNSRHHLLPPPPASAMNFLLPDHSRESEQYRSLPLKNELFCFVELLLSVLSLIY